MPPIGFLKILPPWGGMCSDPSEPEPIARISPKSRVEGCFSVTFLLVARHFCICAKIPEGNIVPPHVTPPL
jgi:hypothetical protein